MTNITKLKSKMVEAGFTHFTSDLMMLLDVAWTTASYKINNEKGFTQKEIAILTKKLNLTGDEVKEIFTGVE